MDQSASVTALIEEYSAFQKTLPLEGADSKTQNLAVFNGNKTKPIHRWFVFKEGFSVDLLGWVIATFGLQPAKLETILDPFCGVATSLLTAQLTMALPRGAQLLGIERNPFIKFVAHSKLNWYTYDPARIEQLLPNLIAPWAEDELDRADIPSLSTIQNPLVFNLGTLQELLGYRERIARLCVGTTELDFFLLGWAAIIEDVSGVRRDGRALRFVEKRSVPTVKEALRQQWQMMLCDLRTVKAEHCRRKAPPAVSIIEGDGRVIAIPSLQNDSLGLIIYSPPYLNNIDYSEVYKLELWMSALITTHQDFRELRRKTLRSHPSVGFPATTILDTQPANTMAQRLRTRLLEAIPDDEDRGWRERLFRAYMDDMLIALGRQYELAKTGSHVICVVGNSMHGRTNHPIIVATDLLVTALAQLVGFNVVRLQVSRQLRRRDHENSYLRETIIVLRKPH